MNHPGTGDSRKLVCLWWILVVGEQWWRHKGQHCWSASRSLGAQCYLPRAGCWPWPELTALNHWRWKPSLRRIEFGIVSRVDNASPVSFCLVASVFIQMWNTALSTSLALTPPFPNVLPAAIFDSASRQMFHCSRITVKFLPVLPQIMELWLHRT
jgi:hypothetical protein